MATILEFRNDSSRSMARQMLGAPAITGKIVIFPGIRVSYWAEPAAAGSDLPPAPQPSSSKKAKAPRRR
jgi:hypothetical protein